MSRSDEDRFRIRPGKPKAGQQRFVSKVLTEVSKAGHGPGRAPSRRPGAAFGRGHAAAKFADQRLAPDSRRVTIKARLVVLQKASPRSTMDHLRYIERDGVGRAGETGRAYGPATDEADLPAFEERGRDDRHQFRFIVAPEDASALGDLHRYTRGLMARVEADLGSGLDWVAVDHWDTDNPHTHVVLRGKDDAGRDLVIAGDYIAHGMRHRAAELATEWLGPRTALEIRQAMLREVEQERWTGLDRSLQHQVRDDIIRFDRVATDGPARERQAMLIGRLQHLQRMGLAHEEQSGVWSVRPDAEQILRTMGERGDIVRTMQRAMSGVQRELVVSAAERYSGPVEGRIAGKGLADELTDRAYLVIDGTDGRAHYLRLPAGVDLAQFPIGGIVQARGEVDVRPSDRTIADLAVDGVYRADQHLQALRLQAAAARSTLERSPEDVVAAHVRRLEALRRAGIVERLGDGVWRVPSDLPERGRVHDAQRLGGVAVELRSHLPIERQVRALGATWLDQRLVTPSTGLEARGFGAEVHAAMRQRVDFLVEQGLAERRGQRVVFARNLLATLRDRDVAAAARTIAAETGLAYRPLAQGQRTSGVYRRDIQLASGRFAMLDDGMGFALVPWRPVVERRLGQTVTAVIGSGGVTWEFGRQRGPQVG